MKTPAEASTAVDGLSPGAAVLMLITPFRAEDPYKAEDAPLMISTCSMVSRAPHSI